MAMRFDKRPLSISDQAELLIDRGLICDDEGLLCRYLESAGYYRLSVYWMPFEYPSEEGCSSRNHKLRPGTTFDQVLELYNFDRRLRLLVMDAIERIEVALRSRWSNAMAMRHGSHAYLDDSLFKTRGAYLKDLEQLRDVVEKRANWDFVDHYYSKYSDPELPPIWAVVEIMSLGSLSRWLSNTNDTKVMAPISKGMGMPNVDIFTFVLHNLTFIRNICAHHERLWNRCIRRQLPTIRRLEDAIFTGPSQRDDGSHVKHQTQLPYNRLVLMAVMMNKISPDSSWGYRLLQHMDTISPLHHADMGFPADWRTRKPWVSATRPPADRAPSDGR